MSEQFKLGDLVEMPSGRLAIVVGTRDDSDLLDCEYEDEPAESYKPVWVRAKLVRLIGRRGTIS